MDKIIGDFHIALNVHCLLKIVLYDIAANFLLIMLLFHFCFNPLSKENTTVP